MSTPSFRNIFFLGIGGIGMSALARFCRKKGYTVAGFDKTPTTLTRQLQQEGIDITYDEKAEALSEIFSFSPDDSLVVFTPAIASDHPQFRFFTGNGYRVVKRSVMLGEICRDYHTLAVAGTHGKTTTSTMLAHLLKTSGIDCNAFLGGISTNYNSNLLLGNDTQMVVEADEYDRSFLTLYPRAAAVTSMDPDHLDIYGEKNALENSFRLFAAQVEHGGTLIHHHSLSLQKTEGVNKYTYSLHAPADYYAENIRAEKGCYRFDVCGKISIKNALLGMPGLHNVENALAAVALAQAAGASADGIAKGLTSFTGVKRRFEKIFEAENLVYIDDYAHHPREISSCIQSIRALYPGKKITAVFQPHLFSRTRDFMHDFAESLSLADTLYLLDIYPARELPIAGITSSVLFDLVSLSDKHMSSLASLIDDCKPATCEILLTIGAGDIDTLVEPIRKSLQKHYGED